MKKTGIVEALNVSPKGFYEGLLLKTGKGVVQINLAKDSFGNSADIPKPGEQITVEIEAEAPRGVPEHQVFRLIRLAGANGHKPGEKPRASLHFSGRVEKLNYALHGEINGGILESGDFLHLKPEGARALNLTAGMSVKWRGSKSRW